MHGVLTDGVVLHSDLAAHQQHDDHGTHHLEGATGRLRTLDQADLLCSQPLKLLLLELQLAPRKQSLRSLLKRVWPSGAIALGRR